VVVSHQFGDKACEMDGARCVYLGRRSYLALCFYLAWRFNPIARSILLGLRLGLVVAGVVCAVSPIPAWGASADPVVVGPSGGKTIGWDGARGGAAETDGTGQMMSGSASTVPVVEVEYTNPGLTPSHWLLTLSPDGTGHFWSENPKMEQAAVQGQPPPAPVVDRDIRVSAEFARHVFDVARHHSFFAEECESHMKVAFQGWKKLSYRGPEGQGSCGFNYAKDKQMEGLGESLVAVAETIVEGSRLDWLLRYDPLGLDHEMEYVVEGAGDGRLQEFGTIRGILEKLAQDEGVLDRVRKRARTLLARAQG
jgi:hypothetical protein